MITTFKSFLVVLFVSATTFAQNGYVGEAARGGRWHGCTGVFFLESTTRLGGRQ
jgi:hypothetical protein